MNKICKLCMKAGETNGFRLIDEEVVNQIGERFQRLTGVAARQQGQRGKREGELSRPRITLGEGLPAPQELPSAAGLHAVEDAGREEPSRKTGEPESSDVSLDADIGTLRIKIGIPAEVLRQACAATDEARLKIAGTLAAQNLQKYPQLAFSASQDPVVLWSDVRRSILNAFEAHTAVALQ